MNTWYLEHLGVMSEPNGFAHVRGICGDEMEFYVSINGDIIEDVRFYTDGCGHTRICGEAAARLVTGKGIEEALALSPALIMRVIANLPADHLHCTILATITFLKAMADYLYKRDLPQD
jgi:nitrogen fixation NifU-like protein